MNKPLNARPVIAIAGAPGSGKTLLLESLAAALNCDTLQYDDYQKATEQSMEEMISWMKQGGDYNQLQVPGFAEAIAQQKSLNTETPLLIETPLGRHHSTSGQFIDYLIWVDTPLDVALARNIKAFVADFGESPQAYHEQLGWLDNYLHIYIQDVRETLLVQKQRLSGSADLCIDGSLPANEVFDTAAHYIKQQIST